MKKFFSEFREFINNGNVMDMAVGIIIGSAFTAIVTSLTTDILNPFIQLITKSASGGNADAAMSALVIPVADGVNIDFAAFISAIINFLLVALVVFCLVKAMNSLRNAEEKLLHKEKEAAPEPVLCPHCKEEVKEGATRCPHCTGEIPAA